MTIVAALADWLGRVGAPWYVFGAQAAIIHGSSRVTADFDVTVIGDLDRVDQLLAALPDAFERRADRAFTERTRVLPLIHTPTSIPVDVVIGSTRFEAEIESRAEWLLLGGARVRVVSVEDLLVLKLLAGRPHDLLDASAVLVAQRGADLAAVRERLAILEEVVEGRSLRGQLDQLVATHVVGVSAVAPPPLSTPPSRSGRARGSVPSSTGRSPAAKRRTPARSETARGARARPTSTSPQSTLDLLSTEPVVRALVLDVGLTQTDPRVWRRLLVRADITFWALHMAIQDAMGWTNIHLHEFRASSTVRKRSLAQSYGLPQDMVSPGEPGPLPSWDHSIRELIAAPGDRCDYLYDFGDCWLHEIRVEDAVAIDSDERLPQCPDGARACPPEDCGGAPMFGRLVAGDPSDFDAARFDARRVRFQDPARVLSAMLRRP